MDSVPHSEFRACVARHKADQIKGFLGNSECHQDADLGRGERLPASGHRQKDASIEASLYTFLQVAGLTVFEKMPILQVLQAPNSQP